MPARNTRDEALVMHTRWALQVAVSLTANGVTGIGIFPNFLQICFAYVKVGCGRAPTHVGTKFCWNVNTLVQPLLTTLYTTGLAMGISRSLKMASFADETTYGIFGKNFAS
jgi:hypothetical protein